jgi:RNA polymerase sigma factor (sigma-70 family)
MTSPESIRKDAPAQRPIFATTHWSVVLAAGAVDSIQAKRALESLCSAYWYPIYAFVRRQGHYPADAQDLTQEFFAELLEKQHLKSLTHREGKFRSFLLKLLQHFLSNERRKICAQKRGGGRAALSFDALEAEERYRLEPIDAASPELAFERNWARALIRRTLVRLRDEYAASGKSELFDRLKDYHPGERTTVSYATLGTQFGLSEAAVKVAVHRMRRRHRDLLRDEIAGTVSTPVEVEEEVRHLLGLFSDF